ncbi:caspase family protein [Leptospira santarosai]|uniref:Caspase domain protein n=2 Tax=Leptospira santarosai TaxID=28183 RepID=M6US31_9LEPT|nr:caspase family protein [Leptospira santarosai]EKR90301.1 caspase domain protein [Leptospira santarosai str. CBC379]EMF90078.1 caspase domain protein [Leptospira santarosai str. ST188]EMO33483.1 caspase domain protein [Leptospira santarosai str. HAI821]EMO47415.1 caspase domain protein [Leptospira santarosai str. ZUN179]EMP04283.1 caspase domain protein [Leptospira santarosai str. HAI1380]
MRKALIVGIDYYTNVTLLNGCVNDAYAVKSVLERHGDGSVNFAVNLLVATGSSSSINRKILKESASELFQDDSDIALFYFSGHGYVETTGGYLIASDSSSGDDGFPMDELLVIVNNSKAKNKIIVLDCCYSGTIGSSLLTENKAVLSEGVTILTASAKDQYSVEIGGSGVFTALFVDALSGGASNLVGDITPGSVYAHIDQALGPWEQRPIFKTNVKRFISLREVQPPISLEDLRKIIKLFPEPAFEFILDPSFEPTSESAILENVESFSILQKYSHVNLVKPVDEEHMYFTAINSKSCRLTALGSHYWNLIKKGRI